MQKDYSPFTPGQPVPIEYFVGRVDEINDLLRRIRASKSGRLQTIFLHGERGIGKSSLASFVKTLAEQEHEFVGLHVFFGHVNSLSEIVRRILTRLASEGVGTPWHKKLQSLFGNYIKQVGLWSFSVEFAAPQEDLSRIVNDFVPSMRGILEKIAPERKGILLILDDINGLATSQEFANWLKSVVDEVATSGQPMTICLLLVGIDERRRSLISQQPSLDRIFHPIELRSWSPLETRDFFEQAFRKVGVTIEQAALESLPAYAGGLPVLAHEIGDAVFSADTDGHISREDVHAGILAATEIVGRKYLQPQVLDTIRSERYHRILRKIVSNQKLEFQRATLMAQLNDDESKVLDNFLKKMTELGVFYRDSERRGVYQFANLMHYLYFTLEAERRVR